MWPDSRRLTCHCSLGPGSPVDSLLAEVWTLPRHLPEIRPTAIPWNTVTAVHVSGVPHTLPGFAFGLFDVGHVCLCKRTEEQIISELSKVPLGTFQENKPIFHQSHKWLFLFVCFSRSFKAGFLRVWSIDLLPLTPPRSPRNRFLGPHLKYTESEPQRGLPGCCIFIGFDFLESNLKYASQTILIRLKLETLSSPHQEALSLLSMNRVCALPAGSPSEPCCLSPLLRLKDLLLREPALSQLE